MQDSSIILYNGHGSADHGPYYSSWYDSSSSDGSALFGEPLSSTQGESYDDCYCLTYEVVDDYSNWSSYKNEGTSQDYGRKEAAYNISGTCLEDYTSYFGCYWGENKVDPEEGCGAYGTSLQEEESFFYEGDKSGGYLNYNDGMQPDYSGNQWLGFGGLDFGGGSVEHEFDDYKYSSNWDNWETTSLYEIIFGS